MKVHYTVDALPRFSNAVITIGTFDGVHEGHKKIIDALIREARAVGGESVIITFEPHPRKIVYPSVSLQLITTLPEKIELLARTGIDHLVVVPFTEEFSSQSAAEYIDHFLIRNFRPHSIIIGYDHRFGKDRKGDFRLLENKVATYNYRLIEIPKHLLDEIAVSSTKIRTALLESDVETANKLLGYPFFFEGLVVTGDKLGRQLGYPTANLEYTDSEKIHLGHGVFAVHAMIGSQYRKGMLSIGVRPTLSFSDERVEVNLFDWNAEIYGHNLRVIVKKFLRPQWKFDSLEALKRQLHQDREDSLRYL